jgi:hypothetical protein
MIPISKVRSSRLVGLNQLTGRDDQYLRQRPW